jgi:hypothetical protein
MSLTSKLVLWLVLSIFLVAGAQAHVLEEGTGVVCDTLEQILEFASLNATPEAIQKINVGKTSCALVQVRYYRGEEVARTSANNKAVQVVKSSSSSERSASGARSNRGAVHPLQECQHERDCHPAFTRASSMAHTSVVTGAKYSGG